MNVWFATPSANTELASSTFKAWKDRGYKTAAMIDPGAAEPEHVDLIVRCERYLGWGWANNRLCEKLPDIDWMVFGGDDVLPDKRHADEIAAECTEHFGGTLGVMQPVGDPMHAYQIKDFCGSPWIGREFRRRANRGFGPFWESYRHFFDDNELQQVAILNKCLWQREDLTHFHNHWSRRNIPKYPHMKPKEGWWAISQKIFEARKSAGFPGSELIP